MTSNAGTGAVEANVGFGAREGVTKSVLGQLNNFFTEFLTVSMVLSNSKH